MKVRILLSDNNGIQIAKALPLRLENISLTTLIPQQRHSRNPGMTPPTRQQRSGPSNHIAKAFSRLESEDSTSLIRRWRRDSSYQTP